MDKNSIIGIVLIAGIFIVWGIVHKPSEEERARQEEQKELAQQKEERKQDSIANAIAEKEAELAALKAQQHSGQTPEEEEVPADQTPATEAEIEIADNADIRTIYLENDLIKVCLSERGGRPCSVELKKYRTYDSLPIFLFDADSSEFGLNYFTNNRHVNTQNLYFRSDAGSNQILADKSEKTISFRYEPEEGKFIEYKYTLVPGRYKLDMQIRFSNMDNIETKRTGIIDLDWMIHSPQQEKGRDNEMMYTSVYYKLYEDEVEHFRSKSRKEFQSENVTTRLEWVAYKDQFFTSVIMADDAFLDAVMKAEIMPESSQYMKKFESTLGLPYEEGPDHKVDLSFYFGPVKYKLLKSQYGDKKLQDLVEMGGSIIKWINQVVIINLFDFLNRFIGNYGIIILIMTIIIKLFLLPLTFKSYMSTAKMKVLKPQIDEINKKIPKEKAMERQQATMALYKKVGVSPLGGCLPMLLQMPILFAMFRFFPTSIELRQQSFLWATDLSTYDAILEWDRYIPFITNSFGNHISLFTLLMTVSTIISMRFNNQSNMSNQQMPGMQTMMYIMPVMFMFILNKFSAGLTYYYFLANLITIGQNLLFKQFIDEEALLNKLESRKAKPKKKSKFQQRMEELAKQQKGYTGKKR